ncbi:MAG: substrate-binding domain-containing protein [Oscillospiraceae bacterium]|nr:substrate-binding domain-containing protein [Oscillospiraceae bacterium]
MQEKNFMNARGRFGLVIPEINSSLDYEFIEGVFAEAKILGYDVIVYTGVFNSIRELRYDNYISGLENIYTLICTQKLDGIIIAAERFHAQDILKKIYDYAVMTSTPCLVLGGETNNAVSMEAEEFSGMYAITRHMIEEHGCRKLYCLAGVPGHKSSLERLRGFTEACSDFGIEVYERDIIYGYFWKNVPHQLGIDIIEGRIESPDAVICCNDVMAVSLTEVLTSKGIRVPEDVKVTGYDGSWDSALNFPSITTIAGRDKQFGADAVCRLYEIITNQNAEQNVCRQYVRFGKSCGCFENLPMDLHLVDMIERSREKRQYLPTDFIHRMSDNATLTELSDNIDEVGHILGDMEGMDICLCSDWQGDMDNPDNFRQFGYSDEMYLLLSKRFGDNEKAHYTFKTSDILPKLDSKHEPCLIVLTSLHCSGQIIGYIGSIYAECRRMYIDEYYAGWCDSVSNGIKMLQKKLYAEYIRKQIENISETSLLTGMLNSRGFIVKTSEAFEKYRTDGKNCYLLMLTYYPSEIGSTSLELIFEKIMMNLCSHRVCAKIREETFAVIIPATDKEEVSNTSQNLIAALESGFRDHFGDVTLPEFAVYFSTIESSDIYEIEKNVYESGQNLYEKRKAQEDSYMDYRQEIYRLRRNITAEPQRDWNIDDMAHGIGISRSHLQRLYKQFFSVSIKDDVITARIKKAMQLLANTNMRIQEIAEHCGYNNDSHLMRQFKEKTGKTALQYRKETRSHEK